MPTVKKSRSGKRVARRKEVSLVEESRLQLDPRVTISALPDDVLLEIFDFYLVRPFWKGGHEDAWQTLVHVCNKWRCIVFAAPQRLQLQLLCTDKTPVQNALGIWPELPIVVKGLHGIPEPQDTNNIIAALKQHSRVCKVDVDDFSDMFLFLKTIRAMEMRDPFPVLTSLRLSSPNENALALPDSFLGGSAPRLREIYLDGIPFPGLPNLLLSTPDLVDLHVANVTLPGYFPPDVMIACLTTLTRLETLFLTFRSPRSPAHRENPLPPRQTRFVLPALTKFYFKGDSEYLEDIVAQIDTPRLDAYGLHITFFNQLIFDTPLLRHFISRTETFSQSYQVKIKFKDYSVNCNLSRRDGNDILSSEISCGPSDWQLASLAQICDMTFSPLPTLERLEIDSQRVHWEDDMEDTQWLEVLTPFTSIKNLVLLANLIRHIAPTLEDLAEERVTLLLPALQHLYLEGPQPWEPVKKAIRKFIAARQLSGRPVTVHHKEKRDKDYKPWEVDN